MAEALETGIVGVNEGIVSTPHAPFGDIKESGLGREGSHHGLEEFVEIARQERGPKSYILAITLAIGLAIATAIRVASSIAIFLPSLFGPFLA